MPVILLYVLAFVVVINCAYYVLFSFFSFGKSHSKVTSTAYPVSVLVCAKNEAKNLKKHIPLWLDQQYPDFELVLINDASTDETQEVMERFAAVDPRIKIVNIENNEAFWGSKKYALTLGIKKAQHKRMLFTDADCYPASTSWISEMASCFSIKKQLILGYGAYKKTKGLLNAIIRFETVMTAVQYFSFAKAGMPYMGVGRNLGYTSNLYYENNGFMSHIKILSGDDDLFVNEVATKTNTALCYQPNAFTHSIAKETWKEWRHQKKRHGSTAKFYKAHHKILLAGYYIFNLSFWLAAVAGLCFSGWETILIVILFRFIFQYLVVGIAAKKLKETGLIIFLPLLDLFLVCLQFSIFISGNTSKHAHWK